MSSNSFYQIDTRYFHLSDKFEWLLHYFLHFIFDYFGFEPPLKSQFWPCSFRPTLKKISPIENFYFFVFYQTTYSTLRKCKNWTCVFLINIYLVPGGGWNGIFGNSHSRIFLEKSLYILCILGEFSWWDTFPVGLQTLRLLFWWG